MSTRIFLTSTGANTWTVPSDWNNSSNTIEVIGAGGGGASKASSNAAGGGGGGGYGKISNESYDPGTSIRYTIGVGGIGHASGTTLDGGDSGDTFWNSDDLATAIVGAGVAQGGGVARGAGGVGKGTIHFDGGLGGQFSANIGGGGGGAAGLNGAGGVGNAGGAGGQGDNSMGGAGGALNTIGGTGTEYDGSHGSGGGGGGGNGPLSGAGGPYGGGAGGSATNNGSSAGSQGLIVITYTSSFTSPRYWVGGTGNWDASTTTNWSATSGGVGGASVPTSSNDAVFDFNSGSGIVTITATATCNGFHAVSSTVSLVMGAQTIVLTGSGTVWNVVGLTITPGTSTIKLTDATSTTKTFAGSDKTYYNIWITGSGTGEYTITGSNTFNDFKVDTPPHIVNFQIGSVQNLETFTVNGTAGNLMTLRSTSSGVPFFLHKITPGTISCDYLSIKDSHVS